MPSQFECEMQILGEEDEKRLISIGARISSRLGDPCMDNARCIIVR